MELFCCVSEKHRTWTTALSSQGAIVAISYVTFCVQSGLPDACLCKQGDSQ